jgi:ABC-type multidrug transport system permease subunit
MPAAVADTAVLAVRNLRRIQRQPDLLIGFTIIFPITFISSAFVPVDSMPAALQKFAELNPITIVVDAMRALWLGVPAGNNVWGAVVWCLVLVAIFAPLAVHKYRRIAGG